MHIRKPIFGMHNCCGARWLAAASANHLACLCTHLFGENFRIQYRKLHKFSYLQVSYSLILILLGSEYLLLINHLVLTALRSSSSSSYTPKRSVQLQNTSFLRHRPHEMKYGRGLVNQSLLFKKLHVVDKNMMKHACRFGLLSHVAEMGT